MRQSLANISDRLGTDGADARLLRLTNNAVFALPTAGLVVQITRTHRLHARVHKVAAVSGSRMSTHPRSGLPAASTSLSRTATCLPPCGAT